MQVFRTPFRPNPTGCAVTIGNFDGVHRGHQAMLQKLVAKAHALKLPAAVMTFVCRSWGGNPEPLTVATNWQL